VRVLGQFELLSNGHSVTLRHGSKMEALLTNLAIASYRGLAREALLWAVWPRVEGTLAVRCLHTLVSELRKLLSGYIHGEPPVVSYGGYYRLNQEAGVCVDAAMFERLASAGLRLANDGQFDAAVLDFEGAIGLYRGDLAFRAVGRLGLEAERLRVLYLAVLGRLADHAFACGDYETAVANGLRMLASEPGREDAHRQVMRCYVRLGQRAHALRQYQLCERSLIDEFGAKPERETTSLFEQIRLTPEIV
jgi:DNA-binding SARP family transcriptional activator